jgi:hypothetical protein
MMPGSALTIARGSCLMIIITIVPGSHHAGAAPAPPPQCFCGKAAKHLEVQKDGPNQVGRKGVSLDVVLTDCTSSGR